MRAFFLNRQKGFTMIELMIVISILGILVTPVIYFEIFSYRGFAKTRYRQVMVEEANRTIGWIAKDFRSSDKVLESWGDDVSGESQLILSLNNGFVAIYSFDQKNRTILRKQFSSKKTENDSRKTVLAVYVDNFLISPINSDKSLMNIKISSSRELINYSENIVMEGVVGRRIK